MSISQHLDGLQPGPEIAGLIRPVGTPNVVEADVFPPLRAQAPDPSIFLPYITEDIAFEEEYEEYLSDLGWHDEPTTPHPDNVQSSGQPQSAWRRLQAPEFVRDIADGISDSESIVSIGELGEDARMDSLDAGREDGIVPDENRNNWEHMSPKTMAALAKSPAGTRRSSSGGGLRPVLPFDLDRDEGSAVDDEDDQEHELGPVPRDPLSPFAGGVDEVEAAYGYVSTFTGPDKIFTPYFPQALNSVQPMAILISQWITRWFPVQRIMYNTNCSCHESNNDSLYYHLSVFCFHPGNSPRCSGLVEVHGVPPLFSDLRLTVVHPPNHPSDRHGCLVWGQ